MARRLMLRSRGLFRFDLLASTLTVSYCCAGCLDLSLCQHLQHQLQHRYSLLWSCRACNLACLHAARCHVIESTTVVRSPKQSQAVLGLYRHRIVWATCFLMLYCIQMSMYHAHLCSHTIAGTPGAMASWGRLPQQGGNASLLNTQHAAQLLPARPAHAGRQPRGAALRVSATSAPRPQARAVAAPPSQEQLQHAEKPQAKTNGADVEGPIILNGQASEDSFAFASWLSEDARAPTVTRKECNWQSLLTLP